MEEANSHCFNSTTTLLSKLLNDSIHLLSNMTNYACLSQEKVKKINKNSNDYDFQLKLHVVKNYYPIIFILGLITNLVTCMAMIKKFKADMRANNRMQTFSFCLSLLCFWDLNLFLFSCLNEYTSTVFNFSIREISKHYYDFKMWGNILKSKITFYFQGLFSCKFSVFFCFTLGAFVSHLHAFIAFDRWYAAIKPLRYKERQLERNQWQILALAIYCVVINLPYAYFTELKIKKKTSICTMQQSVSIK